jgi:CPA1 family monovalent cation:H+ antiporter
MPSAAYKKVFRSTIRGSSPRSVKILTWGGLRGGRSIAMALTLPPMSARDLILVMTYASSRSRS